MEQKSRKAKIIPIILGAAIVAFWTALGGAVSTSLQGFFSAVSHTSSWVVGLVAVLVTGMLFGIITLVLSVYMWLRSKGPTVLGYALLGLIIGSKIGTWLDRNAGGKGKGLIPSTSQDAIDRVVANAGELTRKQLENN